MNPQTIYFLKSLKCNVDKLQTHNTWEPSRSTLELSKVMKSSHAEVFLKLHQPSIQTKLSIFKTVSCITKRSCSYSNWNWSYSQEPNIISRENLKSRTDKLYQWRWLEHVCHMPHNSPRVSSALDTPGGKQTTVDLKTPGTETSRKHCKAKDWHPKELPEVQQTNSGRDPWLQVADSTHTGCVR